MRPERKTPGVGAPGVNDQGQVYESRNALSRGAARCCGKHSDPDPDAQAAREHEHVQLLRGAL